MWPFKRKSEAPAASAPQPVPAPTVRRDWAALPPIQRTVGEHPLTAPSDRFSDDLATHHDPSVSSDQMGHQVSADAPAGIVLTVARSAGTRSDGPVMIPRPRVQRRAQDAATESGEWDGDEAAPAETRPNPVPAAIQPIAVVERPAVEPLPEFPPFTALPIDAQPVPVVSTARRAATTPLVATTVSRQVESPDVMTTAPRLTLGQARRLGLGAPITKVPERAVQRAANEPAARPEVASSSEAQTSHVPSAAIEMKATFASLTAIQRDAQGGGLSPIDGPSVQASTEHDSPRLDLPLAPAAALGRDEPDTNVAMRATVPEEAPPPSVTVPSASASSPPAPAQATTIQRVIEPEAEVSTMTPSASNAEASTPSVQRSAAALPMADLPLAPKPLMRSAARTDPTDSTATSLESPGILGLSIDGTDAPLTGTRRIATLQRSTPTAPSTDSLPQTQPRFDGSSSTAIGQREAFETARPLPAAPVGNGHIPTAPIRPSLQRSIVEVSNTPALSLPQKGSENSQGAPTLTSQGGSPTLTFPQRGRESFAMAPSPTLPQMGRENSDLPLAPIAIQRASDPRDNEAQPVTEPPASLSGFLVQRASWENSREPDPAAASAPAPSAAAAERTSERDMDELAGKLYDRIRSKLRAELLVDRERAGLLTDWR